LTLPVWLQITSFAVLGALLLVDLAVVARRPHTPSLRESSLWVAFYVTLAVVFAVVLAAVSGPAVAGSFVAGWLTEYSLSVDNLFVFVIILSRFGVPRGNQQKVLMIGIIVSLVLRGGCILIGAAAIERFSWVFYLFGAFLVYTAVQLARGVSPGGDEEYRENVMIRQVRRVLPIAERYDGARLVTRHAGRRMLTPMVIVFLAIGSTDLLFALDSIPAIFGLTRDPFIVFTATLFALMGLRQLYFLLGGLLDRLVYLSTGLSVILGFIGVKLILEALHTNELQFLNHGDPVHWAPAVPIWLSLTVIFVVLAVTTVASLLRSRAGHPRAPQSPQPAPPRPGPRPAPRPSSRPTGRPVPVPVRATSHRGSTSRLPSRD
jgi:tellurite resistance protein TerC